MAVDRKENSAAVNSVNLSKVNARDILLVEKLIINISENISSESRFIYNKQQAVEAAKNYADKYQSCHGLLQILGMQNGVSLELVYTPVRFLDGLSIRQFESITDLEKRRRDSDKRRLQIDKFHSHDGITIGNDNQYLMVLGNPGAGKTTFLRRIGLEALKGDTGRFKHDCIPVLIELKEFENSTFSLIKAITEEFKHFGFPPSEEFAIKALEEGKLLILLDGLDEVPINFANSAMKAIDNLVTRFEKNRFIVSCRVAAYRSNLKHDFQVLELADFGEKQIKQFIFSWFSSELDKRRKTPEKCWNALIHPNNKSAKDLAQTPLLLTFLCLVYNRKQNFPPTRSSLFEKALDILLEEWAGEKRIQQDVIYQELHADLEKIMLAEIAYEGFLNNQFFFRKQKIVRHLKNFLSDTVDNPKYLDGQKILQAIAIQQGILVERAEGVYSFSHVTIQEYLTARHISQEDSLIQVLIDKHLTEKHWREVFVLVAGLKDNAEKLLKSIETATQQNINTSKLKELLIWVEVNANRSVADNSSDALPPVGKRALLIALAIIFTNARAKALSLAYDENYETTFAKVREATLAKGYAESLAKVFAEQNNKVKDLYSKKVSAKAKAKAYDNINGT